MWITHCWSNPAKQISPNWKRVKTNSCSAFSWCLSHLFLLHFILLQKSYWWVKHRCLSVASFCMWMLEKEMFTGAVKMGSIHGYIILNLRALILYMQSFICKHLPVSCKCNLDGKYKEFHVAGILTPHKSLIQLNFGVWFLANSVPRKIKFYSLQNFTPGSHMISPASLLFWKLRC